MKVRSREVSASIAVAVGLAWGFFALTCWHLLSSADPLARHPVREQLMLEAAKDRALRGEMLTFFGGQLLIYGLLGLFAAGLSLATRSAFPGMRMPVWQRTILWTVTSLAWVYSLNAAEYPWSYYSKLHPVLTASLFGPVTVCDVIAVVGIAAIIIVLARAAISFPRIRAQAPRLIVYGVIALSAIGTMRALELREDHPPVLEKPHIIVIGIDSLRPDVLAQGRAVGATPNIDAYLRNASFFTDAITPLGRTFASWMSILSGQHPVRSGARDNLMPASVLRDTSTLAHRLRAAGYATAYATDEVRFSNIDESYGFDRVFSPKMGTSDFILAGWSDSPLTNLVTNTWVGRVLFPNSFANRAAAKTYKPDVFVDWLDGKFDFELPTFLSVHLTLPHYPYSWAEDNDEIFGDVTQNPYTYLAAVIAADRQFGRLMESLRRRGALNNAIVVVLSDHGEALGLASDNLLYDEKSKAALGKQLVSMQGHGSSVLSPNQYRVMLALRAFGHAARAGVPEKTRRFSLPASLEDVAPTLLTLAGVPFDPSNFDGMSLAEALTSESWDTGALASRIRFTETGLTTTFMRMGNFKEAQNLQEGMKFFEVDPSTSRIVFRKDRIPDLLAQKERAAMTSQWLLAALPDPEVGKSKYVLVARAGGVPAVVTHTPDEISHPQFVMLLAALRERFGSEMAPGE